MNVLDNPNVRALLLALVSGVLAGLALLQQDAGTRDSIIGGAVIFLGQVLAAYGTPLNKSVGVAKEPLTADGEPA
jgi:hypothetical protein